MKLFFILFIGILTSLFSQEYQATPCLALYNLYQQDKTVNNDLFGFQKSDWDEITLGSKADYTYISVKSDHDTKVIRDINSKAVYININSGWSSVSIESISKADFIYIKFKGHLSNLRISDIQAKLIIIENQGWEPLELSNIKTSEGMFLCNYNNAEINIENIKNETIYSLFSGKKDNFCFDESSECISLKSASYSREQIYKKCLEMTGRKEEIESVLASEPTEVLQEDLGMFDMDLSQVGRAAKYRKDYSKIYQLSNSCQI
ncbi:hypothetical protein N9N67_07090 [Bacteriovoracaceae bacterium]|nr:hypothetical protein [Bacteriovoracaceae bacterium]